jgi:hypothetical protein
MEDTNKQGVQAFARALRVLVEKAKLDGGKSYDELAEKIRQRAADGMIEEALGYVPEELETVSSEDVFRPVKHIGREGKQRSKMDDKPAGFIEKMH